MIGQTAVFFLITFKLFFGTALHATIYLFGRAVCRLIKSLNHKKILFVPYILRIDRISGTLTEREKINCIEQVRLSHAILSEKTVQLSRKVQFNLLQIFII